MFSVRQKREISDAVQKILRDTGHPELPEGEIKFELQVLGKDAWSWGSIRNNGMVQNPSVNPHNETLDWGRSLTCGYGFKHDPKSARERYRDHAEKHLPLVVEAWEAWRRLDHLESNHSVDDRLPEIVKAWDVYLADRLRGLDLNCASFWKLGELLQAASTGDRVETR